jgi:hypothetical protein
VHAFVPLGLQLLFFIPHALDKADRLFENQGNLSRNAVLDHLVDQLPMEREYDLVLQIFQQGVHHFFTRSQCQNTLVEAVLAA